MADHAHAQDNPHGQGHIGHAPPIFYVLNFGALIILMFATIGASKIDLGQLPFVSENVGLILNNIVALLIALVKMMLVILIFMGVKYGTRLIKLWAATGFVWFLLMGIIFGDYFTRDWETVPSWNPEQVDYPVLGSGPGSGAHEEAAAGGH